jgi:DNA polymerase-3 subunit beta
LSLPILSSILLKADDQFLKISATNLDLGIELEVPVKVEKAGAVAVSGGLLGNFLAATPDEQSIKLEVINGNLCVASKSNTTIIKGFPTDDFPTIPRVEDGDIVSIPAALLVQGFRSVSYSAAISDIKPEIASVYVFGDKDEVVFVSTDSFRLAEKRIRLPNAADLPALLIPFKNAQEIVRIFETADDDVEIRYNKNQISFSSPGIYLTSRLVSGVFPNYRQIIPSTKKTEAVILKKDLSNALRLASVFSDKFNQVTVKIIAADNLFEIQSKNPETGENSTKVGATIEGEDVELSFNAKYVLDAFQSIPEESISLTFNGAGRPMVMRGVGNATFIYLVMPMNG